MLQRRLLEILTGCAVLAVMQTAAFGAGQFQFVSGDVKVISQAGAERLAAKGVSIDEGESVATGQNSIAQIKMRDGAILVVQPETRATVELFRYRGVEDGSERFVLRIHRGGFRGITGAIGHTNKQNFRIETPIAQMGVRGTDQESYYFPPQDTGAPGAPRPGAYNKVNVGAMYLRTPAGEVTVEPNQVGYVASSEAIPGLLPNVPEFFNRASGVRTTGVRPPELLASATSTVPAIGAHSVADVVQAVHSSSGINLSDPAGPGPAMTFAGHVEPVGATSFGRSGVNQLIAANGSAFVDTGSDAALGVNWGSWQGPVTVGGNAASGWAHVISAASTTSAAQLAAPSPGLVTATYNYAGGPAPTNQLGVQGTNALSATVNFSTQTITSYNLNATVGATTWNASGSGSFAQFAGSSGISLNGSCAGCAPGPSTGANGQAHGAFVGSAAEGIVTAYGLKSATHSLSGAALLKR